MTWLFKLKNATGKKILISNSSFCQSETITVLIKEENRTTRGMDSNRIYQYVNQEQKGFLDRTDMDLIKPTEKTWK